MGLRYQIGVPAEPALVAERTSTMVRESCDGAFRLAGMDWERFIRVAPARFRPPDVEEIYRDASKARKRQGWEGRSAYRCLAHLTRDQDLGFAWIVPAEHHRVA